MSDIAIPHLPVLTGAMRWWSYRLRQKFQRLRHAFEYARGTLSADTAQQIMLDCRYPAGWFPLLVLDVEETLAQARETFTDHPALRAFIEAGCAKAASKWEDGDQGYEARRLAIDIAEDYARQTNIALIPWDEIHPPE